MSRVRTFVEPFALSYPFAPEMVELKPAMADVHGGVSIAKANETEGFLFLMLAYLGQSQNDKLTLFVNEVTGPSTTIAEGKDNDDTPLRLPAGLLQKGLNRIKIQAERTSGNDEFTKELVLYHRTSPPGDTPPVMNLTTSHKVIGVGEADKFKVTVTYDNLQWYDRIFVFCNGAHFEHPLTPSSVAPLPPLPTSVVIDIPKDKLIEGGNDKTFEIKYRVIDYVTNPSGPPTWSDAVFVEVDLDKISLAPPKLINATSPIDVLASEAGVRVQAEFTAAVTNDQATLKIVGGVPGAPFPTVPFNVNQRANFTLSVAFLLAHQGKMIKVSWVLIRADEAIGESPFLEVAIGRIAADDPRLPIPDIASVTGEVLDTNGLLPDARIRATKIPLKKASTPTWVSLAGESLDGQPVSIEVWPGDPNESAEGISVPAPVDWLKQLKDGTALKVECAVNLDGIKDKVTAVSLPVRNYRVRAFLEVRPVILGVKDSIQEDIPEGGTTADNAVTLSGTASIGQKVQIHDKDFSLGPVTEVDSDGRWSEIIAISASRTYSFTAVAKYGSGMTSTPPRTLKVVDYLEENFDELADQTIQNRGEKVETPLLTIQHIGQGGHNGTSARIWSTTSPVPGQLDGKVLLCNHMFHDGSAQISLKFKATYKRLTFWMSTSSAGSPLGTIAILNNGVRVGEIKTPGPTGTNLSFQDRSLVSGFNELQLYSFSGTVLGYQFDHFRLYK